MKTLGRILGYGAIALGLMVGVASADLLTNGKLFLSANRTTYIGWDGSQINFVVNGTEVFDTADLAATDGVTCGTAAASKVVCLGASKEIATITTATITTLTGTTANVPTVNATNVDAGASATAGTVDVFPTTASKGKTQFTATDNTGNTTTTITNAAQAGAVTYTIPDAGASASFVMTEGAATVNGAKSFGGRITTTDGVASGTAKVVGGRASTAISATDNLLASAGASAHVDHAQTYSIPASTLGASSVIQMSGMVRVTDASGTDSLEVKVYIGASVLTTTLAFDPDAADDFVTFDCELTSRAAASASSSFVGKCRWTSEDGTTYATGANILVPTNLASNGALVAKVSSKWSATTANTNARLEMFNVSIW